METKQNVSASSLKPVPYWCALPSAFFRFVLDLTSLCSQASAHLEDSERPESVRKSVRFVQADGLNGYEDCLTQPSICSHGDFSHDACNFAMFHAMITYLNTAHRVMSFAYIA